MGFILFTGKCHRAGFSILRPVPDRITPCMDVLIDCQGNCITCDASCAVAHHTAVLIAVHAGSGGLCGIGSIGGTINIRPALAAVSALLPLIRQRLGAAGHNGKCGGSTLGHSLACRLGGDGWGIFHRTCYSLPAGKCAAIYNHFMAACIQAGGISDDQALALANLQIFLQGHIAVHGALLYCRKDQDQRRYQHCHQ